MIWSRIRLARALRLCPGKEVVPASLDHRQYLLYSLLARRKSTRTSLSEPSTSRFFPTAGAPESSTGSRTSLTVLFCVASGLVGYLLASEVDALKSYRSIFGTNQNDSDEYFTNPKFGSPRDFQDAIRELRETFPDEDAVTSDPEDLYDHGFSVNDYLPGEPQILGTCKRRLK